MSASLRSGRLQPDLPPDGESPSRQREVGLPSSVVVDENGVVAAIKVGPYANADDINKSLEKVGLEI